MKGQKVYLSAYERELLSARFDIGNISFEGKEHEAALYQTAYRILTKVSGSRGTQYFTADELDMIAIYMDWQNISYEGRADKQALYEAAERIHSKVTKGEEWSSRDNKQNGLNVKEHPYNELTKEQE